MRWYAFRVGSLAEFYVEFDAQYLHRGWDFVSYGADIEIEWRMVRLVISLHPNNKRGNTDDTIQTGQLVLEDREAYPDRQ